MKASSSAYKQWVAAYLPSPWMKLVGLIIEAFIQMDRSEVHQDTPSSRDEVSSYLDVLDGLPHHSDYDVSHPQSLCDHLLRRITKQ